MDALVAAMTGFDDFLRNAWRRIATGSNVARVFRPEAVKSLTSREVSYIEARTAEAGQEERDTVRVNWAVNKLGPISYRVDAEARGVPVTLAGD